MLDRLLDFEERHKAAITVILGAWLVLSWASYARFIDLPDLPFLTDATLLWVSLAFNTAWWGFMRPMIEKRRKERIAEDNNPRPPA